MVWHGDGLLRATARPAMAVLGGLTLSITVGNKGNKGNRRAIILRTSPTLCHPSIKLPPAYLRLTPFKISAMDKI